MDETRATYDAVADRYASRHGDRTNVMDQFDEFCGRLDAGPVLDVGCGPGWETAAFARRGFDALGVDVSREFLAKARDHASDAHVAAMDMRHLGLRADAVGGVWACASVHHVPRDDVSTVLSAFARVTRPGGALAVSVKRGTGTTEGDAYPEDRRRFTCYEPRDLEARLAAAGYRDLDVAASEEWVWAWGTLGA